MGDTTVYAGAGEPAHDLVFERLVKERIVYLGSEVTAEEAKAYAFVDHVAATVPRRVPGVRLS